ncbi:MAG: glycosyltransferase family 4 protein [Crocinitomicaceae bacterium]
MIGMLLQGDYAKDIRVRKEAESMVSAGIEVVVICTWMSGQERSEVIKGVRVIRIGKHASGRRIDIRHLTMSWFFIYWLFYFKAPKVIKEYKVEHLHVHDLYLVKTALKLKKYIHGKVIFDSHENYPELLEVWFLTKKILPVRIKNNLFFKPSRWKRHEKKVLGKVDKVITVVEEMTEKYLRENKNLKEDHFLKISNFERLDFANKATQLASDDTFAFKPETFYVTYVGGIGPIRGVDTVIEAIAKLQSTDKNVEFVILGAGHKDYMRSLHDLVEELHLEGKVHFLGYKPFETVNYYMQKTGVNIIPHKKTDHTDNTIPHKLFQIFLSKAPLLVSSCNPLKRYVDLHDGGWVFEASNPQDLSEKIVTIQNTDDSEKQEKVMNAYNSAIDKYNWEAESERLIAYYKSL